MRTLLIDADVVAYKAASSVEKAIEWDPPYWTWHANLDEAQDAFTQQIETYMTALKADRYELCLTSSEDNFRKAILPTYKGHRISVKKPLVLKAMREWLVGEGAYLKPGLEGDDCMGILATKRVSHGNVKQERIIVSIDKDMKSVPGLYCRDLETGVVEITEAEADRWHMMQTLTGDTTDGYGGCPGIGPKKAEAILDAPGNREGIELWWPRVVMAFEKAKLSEAEALVQARVARILRACDYDFTNKRPILWEPPH